MQPATGFDSHPWHSRLATRYGHRRVSWDQESEPGGRGVAGRSAAHPRTGHSGQCTEIRVRAVWSEEQEEQEGTRLLPTSESFRPSLRPRKLESLLRGASARKIKTPSAFEGVRVYIEHPIEDGRVGDHRYMNMNMNMT